MARLAALLCIALLAVAVQESQGQRLKKALHALIKPKEVQEATVQEVGVTPDGMRIVQLVPTESADTADNDGLLEGLLKRKLDLLSRLLKRVLETGADVLDSTSGVVGDVVNTASGVVDGVVDTAAGVVDTAAGVVNTAVETKLGLLDDTIDTTLGLVGTVRKLIQDILDGADK